MSATRCCPPASPACGKNEIYGWNTGLTSTNHGRPRRSVPAGFGGRITRPSDTASRSRKCVSRTAPRLQVLTECLGRRLQQHRRRAHHERELAKRRRTRRPLPLCLRYNGNVTKTLHATPSSASSWGRAPIITRLQDLSRIQLSTRRIPRYPDYRTRISSSGSSMHACMRDLAKSGQGYWDPVELQVRQ